MAGDVGWVGLDDRALLRVEGPDARDLLQGLVSNDLGRLAPGRALYAALLTPQGKYLFDFVLLDDGRGAVLVDVERARAAELRQRLLMYRLRAKAEIEDAPADLAVVAVFGEGAAERLGLPAEAGSARAGGEPGVTVLVVVDPRLADLGCRAVLPRAGLAAFTSRHGLRPATAEDYDLHRLRLGVPDGSRDLVPQRSTLLESGAGAARQALRAADQRHARRPAELLGHDLQDVPAEVGRGRPLHTGGTRQPRQPHHGATVGIDPVGRSHGVY